MPPNVRSYFTYREDLYYINRLVLEGNRFFFPKTLQNEMKTLLYNSHFGIVEIKNSAREIVFWPGMNNDIENIVGTFDICQQHHKRQRRETYIPHEIPHIPWNKVDTDLFEIYSKSYLIAVDYTSISFDISEIPDKHSSTVVLQTKRIFCRYGIPKEVILNNGPEDSLQTSLPPIKWII